MLQGAIAAATRVGLMLNVKRVDLPRSFRLARAEEPYYFRAQRFGLGGGKHDYRRGRGSPDLAAVESGKGAGHRRISLE